MRAPVITEEEYLIREPEAEYKSEFRDGEMVAMSGASPAHGRISANLTGELYSLLKGSPCQVFTSDTRVKVQAARFYTYPDVSVVCGEPVYDNPRMGTLLNPILIVEVLSRSTETYDRGEKFKYYQKLGSLQDYLLVAQDRVCVERFSRQEDGRWTSVKYESIDDIAELPSAGCSVALRDVYDKVHFGSS